MGRHLWNLRFLLCHERPSILFILSETGSIILGENAPEELLSALDGKEENYSLISITPNPSNGSEVMISD
jgi:hypothetical protein